MIEQIEIKNKNNMKYLDFINESKEWTNCMSLIDNDDPSNNALGLALASNFQNEFQKKYNCTVDEYTRISEILQEYNGKYNMPLLKITKLDITKTDVSELLQYIYILKNLTELNIQNNKINVLPDVICNLSKLSILDVSNNILTELPKNIGDLKNLTELNIQNNNITNLPDSASNLKKLNKFRFVNNINLKTFPSGFHKVIAKVNAKKGFKN